MNTSESKASASPYSIIESRRRFGSIPPPATLVILLITVAAFIGQAVDGGNDWKRAFGIVPENLSNASSIMHVGEGQRVPACVTLLSYMFLHAGFFHLLTNMAALWMFGIIAEPVIGTKLYAAIYLVFGVVTGVIIVALVPHWAAPMVGASGAISGIVGAFLALRYSQWVRQTRPTSLIFVIEALPVLVLIAWLAIRTDPPEPDRASAAAWHLIPFMIAWYGERIVLGFARCSGIDRTKPEPPIARP